METLSLTKKIKMSCFSRGIKITANAKSKLTQDGKIPLFIYEYATTAGLTFKFQDNTYINAPFGDWYCDNPDVTLDFETENEKFFISFNNEIIYTDVLPLPSYLNKKDLEGKLVSETIMSHADRARISPIAGCIYACKFCDYQGKKYNPRPLNQILNALSIVLNDKNLPVKHILISGGTPKPKDYSYLENIIQSVINTINLPVDVMMVPNSSELIDNLFDLGIFGLSMNLEIYNEQIAQSLIPQKNKVWRRLFIKCLEKAIQKVGGNGRVRSLIIIGLEPIEDSLKGIELLAKIGCDPVLSPFRPGRKTPLENIRPPNVEDLKKIYIEALEITDKYKVKLGPRCIPCQHNTLTFPDSSDSYYFS
jgi:hypothetical protein